MKLLLKTLITLQVALYAPVYGDPAPPTCHDVVKACTAVIEAQDKAIENLRRDNKVLADALVEASKPPLLPTWAIISLSVLTGVAAAAIVIRR